MLERCHGSISIGSLFAGLLLDEQDSEWTRWLCCFVCTQGADICITDHSIPIGQLATMKIIVEEN